jgi:hypothetical protein
METNTTDNLLKSKKENYKFSQEKNALMKMQRNVIYWILYCTEAVTGPGTLPLNPPEIQSLELS